MIRAHTFSEAGGRPENEDAFVVRELPDGWLVCLADGQGGAPGGARAARVACDTAAGVIAAGHRTEPTNVSAWEAALAAADAAVTADPAAGYTTLIGFGVSGDVVAGASCGDSAVLARWGTGQIAELTRLQFKNPPVGSREAVFVHFATRLSPPWRVLAVSDGVWKYVGWPRVYELLGRHGGEDLLSALRAAARLPGSGQFPDDFTAVLVEREA